MKNHKTVFLIALMALVTTGMLAATPRTVAAFDVYDYFIIAYEPLFSQTEVTAGEEFTAVITGTATCRQDLPLEVAQGYLALQVVAEHHESDQQLILNPGFSLTVEPFPNNTGETTTATVTIPLTFPSGSPTGSYDIYGEVIEARIQSDMDFWVPV